MPELKAKIRWLKDEYFPQHGSGDIDSPEISLLKGMLRESEAERLWSLRGIPQKNITNLRSKFYSGHEFKRTPRYADDVLPFIALFNKVQPDLITIQDDAQSGPPITSYKVLQIIAQALRSKEIKLKPNLQILGYRNVLFKYQLSEANTLVPVSGRLLAEQKQAYNSCFNTQKMSSFPSPFFAGDYAAFAENVQQEQLAELRLLLGNDFFSKHKNPEVRNAKGFVYMKQMTLDEVFRHAEVLQIAIDLEEAYVK